MPTPIRKQIKKMLIRDQILEKLQAEFNPSYLNVEDQSELHRGHAGWNEGGESHFHIQIDSKVFLGMSRLKQHRAVYAALTPQLVKKIHAISMEIFCN